MQRTTTIRVIIAAAAAVLIAAGAALAAVPNTSVRLKDVARIQGVRENQLLGFGVVVGLNGTGDGVKMTQVAVKNMMENLGITMNVNDVNVDNIAAVIVTASLPAFTKAGDKLDITVSSVGDADSIRGGTLVMTPLKGADGKVYAVAQGPVSIGGYTAGLGGGRSTKGFPTTGRIPGGATVENEVPTEIMTDRTVYINLNNPDFTLAARTQNQISDACKTGEWIDQFASCKSGGKRNTDTCTTCSAIAVDAATIKIVAPGVDENNIVSFISAVESLEVIQDEVARVVVNEKTGTIVMGGDVKVGPVEIAHGSLSVKIEPGINVSQPNSLGGGNTAIIKNPSVKVVEPTVSIKKVTAGDIVKALNDMGVTPSDIIAILQALKTSGALQADLIVQ